MFLITSALGAKFLGWEDVSVEDEEDFEFDFGEGDITKLPNKRLIEQPIDLRHIHQDKFDVTTNGE